MPRSPYEKRAIAFMIVWLVFWTSAILVALYIFGRQVLQGEPQAAIVLVFWLIGAGFGLYLAARRLLGLILVGKAQPRSDRPWRDGIDPPDLPPAGR